MACRLSAVSVIRVAARCSALIETESTRILIDCGPDFRQQIMSQPFRKIDGILTTHAHYDHMGGMDDIRPYCQFGEINVYADPIARQGMLQMLPYCCHPVARDS